MPGFHVGDVGDAAPVERRALVDHPLQDKGVKPVARPAMSNRQRFDHNQGHVQTAGVMDGVLQSEVVLAPSRGGHPVQHVMADMAFAGGANVEPPLHRFFR